RYGSIAGIKFHDADQDGIMDDDEMGIDGVTVILEPGPHSTETTGGGGFSFDRLKAGTYRVTVDEDSLPGYFPTGPSSVEVQLGHGERVFLYFGNAPRGSITGRKWLDADMDGVWDSTETETLAGITIELYRGYPPEGEPLATAVTGEDGTYQFGDLLPGTYTVVERPTAGMFPTTPTQVKVEVVSGAGCVVDFGNCPYGTVRGTKFADLDGDGLLDEGETGLAGVTITLESVTEPGIVITTESGEDGSFSFTGLAPGLYRVRETVPAGYYATLPVSVEVELQAGDIASLLFANALYASVSGHKWQDNDGDGAHDPDEPPVGGITVVLTGYTLGDERVEMQTTTADDGSYSFLLLEAGNYSVYEVMPYNMEATTTDRYDLLIKPGDRVTDLDFFNALVEAGGEVTPPPPTPGPGPVTPPTQPPVQVAPEVLRGQLPATGAPTWIPLLIAALLILAGCMFLAGGMRRKA
ncbi:MAG: SdrD B-like domain-containing protein, partial [Candidatus Geothermincolales bacterium]